MTRLSIARSNASGLAMGDGLQQPVAREGSVRVLDEQAQQLEFAGAQAVRRAVGKRERPALQVQHRGTDPHLRQPWRRRCGCRRAAQQRLHARDEFPRFERLSDIVVRARLQAHNPVDRVSGGGKHEDADARRPAAQPACQSEAVLRLVQMHVEQCDVRHGVLSQSLEFRAGGERGRTQAMLRQALGDDLPLECLIFDQNDLRRAVQAGFSLVVSCRRKQVTIDRCDAARH